MHEGSAPMVGAHQATNGRDHPADAHDQRAYFMDGRAIVDFQRMRRPPPAVYRGCQAAHLVTRRTNTGTLQGDGGD
jgi:hypothetical protein